MISITLPYPPSVNHYWRQFRGRAILSAKGRAYRVAVLAAVLEAGRPRVEGRLSIEIRLTMPDRRKRDLDNVQKAILDGLGHAGVYEDDSQIDRILVERGAVDPPGCANVTLTEIREGSRSHG